MLIVAIPKSASTSLMKTLGCLHNVPSYQITCKEFPCPSTKILHHYHSDIRELNCDFVAQFSNDQAIYKQHIAPTVNNLKLTRGFRKIILLRNPEQVVEAYYRAELRKIHKARQEFVGCTTIREWKQAAQQNGLLNDLFWFKKKWIEESEKNSNMNLLIDYSDLVFSPKKTINMIEEYLELPISSNVNLLREKYSRGLPRIRLLSRFFR